nr:hypothetical protein [uncultured Arsenicibacter sp.]
MVSLNLKTAKEPAGGIRIWEETPDQSAGNPYGFGGTNAPRSSIVRVRITVGNQKEGNRTFTINAKPDSDFMNRRYILKAKDLVSVLPGCEVYEESDTRFFQSGCMPVTVEVLSQIPVTRNYFNYAIQIPAGLSATARVMALKNGAWVDITAEGQPNNIGWFWRKLNSLDEYLQYEVREGNGKPYSGIINRQRLDTTGIVGNGQETLAGSGRLLLFLAERERSRWADLVHKVLIGPKECAERPVKYPDYFGAGSCREGKIAYIGMLLDYLEDWDKVDCNTGSTILRKLQNELDEWEETL